MGNFHGYRGSFRYGILIGSGIWTNGPKSLGKDKGTKMMETWSCKLLEWKKSVLDERKQVMRRRNEMFGYGSAAANERVEG